jgi:hypothetical protein
MASLVLGCLALALISLVGCQGQPDAGGKGGSSAATKKVTVDVTGMT